MSPSSKYEIVLDGQIDPIWQDWLSCSVLEEREGQTRLFYAGVDQAALRGILIRIFDLNLTLISIVLIKPLKPAIDGHPFEMT